MAIPTHEMPHGGYFLKRCLDSLWNQSFQDFEIVVTDNSDNDVIKEICTFYGNIRYFRNPRKGMAQNTNEAIKRSEGELIKILYMDDFLSHDRALVKIVNNFEGEWLITACTHIQAGNNFTQNIHHAQWSSEIFEGKNTIGSPSVLTIKNNSPIFFDESMTWMLDVDYYSRMYKKHGEPTILNDINVVIGLHSGQMTNLLSDELKNKEQIYLNEKIKDEYKY